MILESIGGLLGGLFSSSSAKKQNAANLAAQREAAQNQVQWRAEDARKAGVGTLAALGMQPVSISPSTVGGPDWSSIGQNLGRAADASVSKTQQALNTEILAGQRDKIGLENDLIRRNIAASDIMLRRQAGTGVGVPGSDDRGEKVNGPMDIAGLSVQRNPYFSDAQDITNRYGETIGDFVYGPAVAVADTYWNADNSMRRKTLDSQRRYYYSMKRGRPGGGAW